MPMSWRTLATRYVAGDLKEIANPSAERPTSPTLIGVDGILF